MFLTGSMEPPKVIILSGGKGTRLPVSARDIPKSLVEVGGKTILEHQIERLQAAGFHNIRLSLGFRADQIISFLKERKHRCDFVVESEPLGTGGAARFASRDLAGPFMVLNGDTFGYFDFRSIRAAHEPGFAVMATHWKDDARDFGLLGVRDGFIREYLEKPKEPVGGYINAGCYMLHPNHFAGTPKGFFMLEQEVFPRLAREGLLKAHSHEGFWEDLGTEARLERIRKSLELS